jgi:hypothetical protein
VPRGRVLVPNHLADERIWQLVEMFSCQLSDPASPLYKGVNVLGLEFDLPRAPSKTSIPSIFFELNREIGSRVECVIEVAERLPLASDSEWDRRMSPAMH